MELEKIFERQVSNFKKIYRETAGLGAERFVMDSFVNKYIYPLKNLLKKQVNDDIEKKAHTLFLIVIPACLVPLKKQISWVRVGRYHEKISSSIGDLEKIKNTNGIKTPTKPYLIFNIRCETDTGVYMPEYHIDKLVEEGRYPLTVEEGIALLTHYPGSLGGPRTDMILAGSSLKERSLIHIWSYCNGQPAFGDLRAVLAARNAHYGDIDFIIPHCGWRSGISRASLKD